MDIIIYEDKTIQMYYTIIGYVFFSLLEYFLPTFTRMYLICERTRVTSHIVIHFTLLLCQLPTPCTIGRVANLTVPKQRERQRQRRDDDK